jgi:hypothetical protein
MKRMISVALVLSALVLGASAGFAQDAALAVSAKDATVDGVVKPGEYSWTKSFGQLELSLTRTADTLWIGAVGTTTGWVSVGLGTLKMDKSAIFIGFVDSEGKTQFKPQLGAGRTHADTTDPDITGSLVSSAMKEQGGKTTLEFALSADTWIVEGQAALNLIYAIGSQDSFSPRHTMRGAFAVPLAK